MACAKFSMETGIRYQPYDWLHGGRSGFFPAMYIADFPVLLT